MKKPYYLLLLSLLFSLLLAGCTEEKQAAQPALPPVTEPPVSSPEAPPVSPPTTAPSTPSATASNKPSAIPSNKPTDKPTDKPYITPTDTITELTAGLSVTDYQGDYGFDAFLKSGGAKTDGAVVDFLSGTLLPSLKNLAFTGEGFGCSTLSVSDGEGNVLFGRNFDWQACNALIVTATPSEGYASISTVNLDFLSGYGDALAALNEKAKILAALYAPLDGMNEKGLCAAVLMIADSEKINQNSDKPDLTTTTALRLLLDKAANVAQAIALLEQYDMHSSMDMMVHFALSDTSGRSVVIEYIDQKMLVTETPVVTNFYLATGDKNGMGSDQSHARYKSLMEQRKESPQMDMDAVANAMDSVSKDNYDEFSSTEWSIVYNQSKGEALYYHRENYSESFAFRLG